MKNIRFLKIILAIILLFGVFWGYKFYVSKSKIVIASPSEQFKIDFSNNVIWDDSTKKNICVKNKNGQSVSSYVYLSSDSKSIIINPPIGGYTPNENYSITISPEIHIENYKLKSKMVTKFKVVNSTISPPLKEKRTAKYGDIIGVSKEFMGYKYEHYGVYIGDNKVIHFCSSTGKVKDTEIQETAMGSYFKTGEYFILNINSPLKLTPEEVVSRAKTRIGEKNYDLLQNNCEHFALWCKTGNCKSYQVDNLSEYELTQLNQFIILGINLQ